MLTAQDVHVLDRNSEYFGTPTKQLMENAGRAVAEFIHTTLKTEQKNILKQSRPHVTE